MGENMTFVFNGYDLIRKERRNITPKGFIRNYFFLYLSVIRMAVCLTRSS